MLDPTIKPFCGIEAATPHTNTIARVQEFGVENFAPDQIKLLEDESGVYVPGLGDALRYTELFPPMVYNMVGIGEETGDLQGMLEKTADYYDDEVETATQSLLSLLEPFIMIVLAFFVVILVLAIFLPMLNMTSAYDQYL